MVLSKENIEKTGEQLLSRFAVYDDVGMKRSEARTMSLRAVLFSENESTQIS